MIIKFQNHIQIQLFFKISFLNRNLRKQQSTVKVAVISLLSKKVLSHIKKAVENRKLTHLLDDVLCYFLSSEA
jgi:hypothetical protein